MNDQVQWKYGKLYMRSH